MPPSNPSLKEQLYRQHIIDRFSTLKLFAVNSTTPVAIDLESVFVKLKVKSSKAASSELRSFRMGQPFDFGTRYEQWLGRAIQPLAADIVTQRQVSDDREEQFQKWAWDPASGTGDFLQIYLQYQKRIGRWFHNQPSSIQDILTNDSDLAIIGSAGGGKTTLLKYLALKFARHQAQEVLGLEREFIPLFVALRDFNSYLKILSARHELLELSPTLLPQFLQKQTHLNAPHLELPDDFFERALREKRCIVLCDGLDEVADSSQRGRAAETLANIIAHYEGNRFVVTSRPRGYEQEARQRLSTHLTECHVLDFDATDRKAFVEAWYQAVTIDLQGDNLTARDEARLAARDLLRAIESNPRLVTLAKNPLLLSVLAMVHQRGLGLPQRRAALYNECTLMLLGYWDQTKGGEAACELATYGGFDNENKRELLAPIALWFHEGGDERIEVEDTALQTQLTTEFVAAFSDDERTARNRAQSFLRLIDERTGLLEEREAGVYAFSHLTFQEYLAARAIADREDYIEYLTEHLHQPWWREVLLLAVGHLSDVSSGGKRARKLTTDLLNSIRGAGSWLESSLHRDLLLVARCLCDVGQLAVEEGLRRAVFEELLTIWSASLIRTQRLQIEEVFRLAVSTLEGQPYKAKIEEMLLTGLRSTDLGVHSLWLDSLESLGSLFATPPVLTWAKQRLEASPHLGARTLAYILRQIAPEFLEQTMSAICEAMLQDSATSTKERISTLSLLDQPGFNAEVEAYLLAQTHDPDEHLSQRAIELLCRRADKASRAIVERVFAMTEAAVEESETAFGGCLADLSASLEQEDFKRLFDLTYNPASCVRANAIKAVVALRREVSKHGLDWEARLFEMLEDTDVHARAQAVEELSELDDLSPQNSELLQSKVFDLAHDPDSDVRIYVFDLLAKMIPFLDAEVAVAHLIEMMETDDELFFMHSQMLGNIGSTLENEAARTLILNYLFQHLESGGTHRFHYALALGEMGERAKNKVVLQALWNIADDENEVPDGGEDQEMLRHTTVWAMSRVGGEEFVKDQKNFVADFWKRRLDGAENYTILPHSGSAVDSLSEVAFEELCRLAAIQPHRADSTETVTLS